MCRNVNLKILKKRKNAIIPTHATDGSAGLDLCACIENNIILNPNKSVLIPTGLAIELPSNDMAAFIFARSGLSIKFGIALSNGVGVIDSDYRGEICVGLRNFGEESYIIKKNERIAQLIVMPISCLSIVEVNMLNDTIRGQGGFGSTGN